MILGVNMDILVIPDTQVKPGVCTDHLEALGNYVVEHQPKGIVHLGDHWDMQSLSMYDVGKIASEGARYTDDIEAGIEALYRFEKPTELYNRKKYYNKKKRYTPWKKFLLGNHENRIYRHVQSHPYLEGKLNFYEDSYLRAYGWELFPFLAVKRIEGIHFSHYFTNPDSAKRLVFSSSIDFQLMKLGFSFIQGHRQGLYIASPRFSVDGRATRGLIAGSFYMHDEEYMHPQALNFWKGAIHLQNVRDGWFEPKELELNWLLENYT